MYNSYLKSKLFTIPLLFLIVAMLHIACGDGGSGTTADSNSDANTPHISDIIITNKLPEVIKTDPMFVVDTPFESINGAEDFSLNGIQTDNPFIISAKLDDYPVAFSIVSPENSNDELSCDATAVALVFMNTNFIMSPSGLSEEILEMINDLSSVETLSMQICLDLTNHSDALVNPDSALKQALRVASEEAIETFLNMADAAITQNS